MALFKLHIPILDDIKAKGWRSALVTTVDQTVERITAGINIGEIRSILRGEAPKRPNPRVKPHADGFWMHMRPTFFHEQVMSLYPTFRLGWLTTYMLVFETITGLFLMLWYTPSPDIAYTNMLSLLSNVPFGLFMRDLHRLGAELMVMLVLLHMLRTFVTGSYKKPRQFTWFTGGVLLLLTLFLSFSGYLLPWDQLALWAVTIGASMAEATPVVGREVNLLVRGGADIGANGLLRFYLLHVFALPLIAFIFVGVHYYKVIIHGHSLPPGVEKVGEDTARKVPMERRLYFLPDVMTRELFWTVGWLALMVFMVTWGGWHAPLEPHADPQITPLHTTAPWYFLWLQGMLKLGDKVFFGVILPGILSGLLFVMPYLEVGPSRRYADRRIGLSIAALVIVIMSVLTFMGTPYYGVSSSPDQEVLTTLAPQTHPGLLRGTAYDDLPVGDWVASGWNNAPSKGLQAVLQLYNQEIERNAERLVNAKGKMSITEIQAGLKKVTMQVEWEDNGAHASEPLTVYLHRDSAYEH